MTAEQPTEQMLELFADQVEPLRRYALRLTSNHAKAEDVVQETLLRAWRHLQSKDDDQPGRAWLFTVARNIVIDDSRSARVRCEVCPPDTSEVPDRMVADEANAALDRILVAEAIAQLPATQGASRGVV